MPPGKDDSRAAISTTAKNLLVFWTAIERRSEKDIVSELILRNAPERAYMAAGILRSPEHVKAEIALPESPKTEERRPQNRTLHVLDSTTIGRIEMEKRAPLKNAPNTVAIIYSLMSDGLSRNEIADTIGRPRSTVKEFIKNNPPKN